MSITSLVKAGAQHRREDVGFEDSSANVECIWRMLSWRLFRCPPAWTLTCTVLLLFFSGEGCLAR